jgi:hypothetical protein
MKKSEFVRLLGNLKADLMESLENGKDSKPSYINTPIVMTFTYILPYGVSTKRHTFTSGYITTDEHNQSFYGYSTWCGHNIYMTIDDFLIKTMEILE